MKYFNVDVDITMSCRIEVEAESEEQAKTIVGNWIGDAPMHYVRDGHYMSHEFEAVNECEQEEEKSEIEKAIDYVRENMDEDDLLIIKATVSKNLKNRQSAWYGVDYGIVERLLYDYGEEHNLIDEDADQEWWEKYGDIDDILVKI